MIKADRRGWAAEISLKSYGVRLRVRTNEPSWLPRVWQHLPYPCRAVTGARMADRVYSLVAGPQNGGSEKPVNLIYADDVRLARSVQVDEIFDRLETDARLFVAELASDRLFVHAGVVSWQGKAIVIPGRSYSGKTTMVAELVKAGAVYYSDEYAVFDAHGLVHPFPKALELRQPGQWQQSRISVEQLGGRAGRGPIPLGLVLVSGFKAGVRWRPQPISFGQAALALLANTVSARRNPEQALAILEKAVVRAESIRGMRGDAGEIVASILQRIEKKGESRGK
jgi:hypothetical protein